MKLLSSYFPSRYPAAPSAQGFPLSLIPILQSLTSSFTLNSFDGLNLEHCTLPYSAFLAFYDMNPSREEYQHTQQLNWL